MAVFEWERFLIEYSHELAERVRYLDWAEVPVSAREAKWFGFPPATEIQIADTEQKLGIQLPADVREFYEVTNGWMFCGHTIYDIRPVERLCWLSEGDPDLWSLCEVRPDPPKKDSPAFEWWYEQGIKVRRSLMLNIRGDDAALLYDPEPNLPETEFRLGTWAAWHPAMQWNSLTLSDFFRLERESLPPEDLE